MLAAASKRASGHALASRKLANPRAASPEDAIRWMQLRPLMTHSEEVRHHSKDKRSLCRLYGSPKGEHNTLRLANSMATP